MAVSFNDAIHTVRGLIGALYVAIEEGVFDDSAQTEDVLIEQVEQANLFLRDAGHEPYTYDEWRAERDDDPTVTYEDGELPD